MSIDYFRQSAFSQGVSDSYTALRSSSGEAIANSDGSFDARKSLRRFIGYFLPPYDAELRNLNVAIKEGHREGVSYHRRLYKEDPQVKAWVHQAHYL